ncbi:PTS sugar transporter subunit IIA [Polaromonas sp.]|uniref:PTS sugar transporter subunit IIA n=1 Tax=Polaromonas sp. TaxID=1869339 RepID=UPI0037535634
MIQTLRLKDVLSSERVLLGASVTAMQQAFEVLGQLAREPGGPQSAEIARRLLGRERHSSTALGYGVAIPHAQVTGLRRPVAAFLRSSAPLAFNAPDGRPVFDMLGILVPKPAVPYHFALLGDARHLLGDRDFRQALAACGDALGVWQLFEQWPHYRSPVATEPTAASTVPMRVQQSNVSP